jgi:hypothetical protein
MDMYQGKITSLLLPARNEELSLRMVLRAVPLEVDRILVLDNGSTDATAQVAESLGAQVVAEPRLGYGRACLAGLAVLKQDPPDIVAFADADGSDDLSRLPDLLDPLVKGQADLVLGSRRLVESRALSLPQRLGNWLVTRMIRLLWGHDYRDIGPMRAITWKALQELQMSDPDFGWTLEMQIKALKAGFRVQEIAVSYRMRVAGRSKVSRNIRGVIRAGAKFLWVIGREALGRRKPRPLPG